MESFISIPDKLVILFEHPAHAGFRAYDMTHPRTKPDWGLWHNDWWVCDAVVVLWSYRGDVALHDHLALDKSKTLIR